MLDSELASAADMMARPPEMIAARSSRSPATELVDFARLDEQGAELVERCGGNSLLAQIGFPQDGRERLGGAEDATACFQPLRR